MNTPRVTIDDEALESAHSNATPLAPALTALMALMRREGIENVHVEVPKKITQVKVVLFRRSGKYYTEELWRVPEEISDWSERRGDFVRGVIGPYDMVHSPDFRRIDNGAVLIEAQEPWGVPHVFPSP